MADPITALTTLGLADNVFSFAKLALKLSQEAYNNTEGFAKKLGDIKNVAQALRSSSKSPPRDFLI